jgi:acyl carrier protein
MDRQTVLNSLDEMLELKPGTLAGAEDLADLDSWDSLAMMNFIAFASDRFDLTISPRQIAPCQTINDLVRLLDTKSEPA